MKKFFWWAGLLLLIGSVQAAGWYRWTDKSGKVHYSDAPPADATDVQKQKSGEAPLTDNADVPYETRRAQQNFPVTLYVVDGCGDGCQQARDLLNKRGIPFSENSLKTKEEFDTFKKLSGNAGVPVLTVGKVWLKGFQAEQWHSELDDAGYPKTAPYRAPASAKPAKPAEEKSRQTPTKDRKSVV